MDFPGGDEQDEEETEININGFAAGKVFFVTGSLSDVGHQEVVPLKPVSEKGGRGGKMPFLTSKVTDKRTPRYASTVSLTLLSLSRPPSLRHKRRPTTHDLLSFFDGGKRIPSFEP